MSALIHDLRYAARTLARRPGFSLAIIVTLAFGIGANTGMFSFVHGILLRPLPYQQPERLVVVEAERDVSGVREPVRAYSRLPISMYFADSLPLSRSPCRDRSRCAVARRENGTGRVRNRL